MSPELLASNLAAWSLQVAAMALVLLAGGRLVPIESPRLRLRTGQAALAVALLLPLLQPWHPATEVVGSWLSAGGAPAPALPADAPVAPTGDWQRQWPAVLAVLLALGALLQLGRLGLGLLRLRGLGRAARPLEAPPWLRGLRDEVAPGASFLVSAGPASPATFGLLRPVILLPAAFARLEREQQQAIALHELLHVRGRHWLALLAEEACGAVLFFHPAVHWLVARIRLAREQCVDAEVVARLGSRAAYLDSLITVARATAASSAVPAAPFLRENHLRERVDLLLKEKLMSRTRTLAHVSLTALAAALVLSWTAFAAPLQSSAPKADTAAKAASIDVRDEVSGSEMKLVHKVNPAYPAEAKKDGVQGIYQLDIKIATDGATRDVKVSASASTAERLKQIEAQRGTAAAMEGDKRLAEAAIAAVQQWRYQPIAKAGKPVEARATVTVNFKLQ